ncbi:short-subunit dehydrogenase involved in D-alanine esterification of teichoic acids [Nakamurella sp. UYEF19]
MTGNTILITGGTSGIGLGLAQRFHAAGNKVIVAGRREDLLAKIVAENDGIDSEVLDVADPDSITAVHRRVTSRYPELNVLINMAGVMQTENLLDPSFLAIAETTVTTNLLGPIRMISAFMPLLTGKDHAVIMNVSSGLAFVPLPVTPTYNATKSAIHSFTESLRVQLAEKPVQIMELIPPAVQTTLLGQENDPNSMPLDEYLSEVMTILADDPDATQICVERVKTLRFAEADGNYDTMLKMLSGH